MTSDISTFREDLISYLPALQLLQTLGHQYLSPADAIAHRTIKRNRVILEGILTKQLGKLNQITLKGQSHEFTANNLREAVDAIANVPLSGGLMDANEKAFDLLTLGNSPEQTIDGNKRRYTRWP